MWNVKTIRQPQRETLKAVRIATENQEDDFTYIRNIDWIERTAASRFRSLDSYRSKYIVSVELYRMYIECT